MLYYQSRHARVLEGFREARIRAFDGAREFCVMSTDNCDRHPAVALWVHAPSGRVSPLCAEHRDAWLADPDIAGTDDPPALVPLFPRAQP